MAEFLIFIRNTSTKSESGNYLDNVVEKTLLTEYQSIRAKIEASTISTAEKDKSLSVLDRRYDARYQYGDILEVREDGYWRSKTGVDDGSHGFNKNCFAVIKAPKISYSDAVKYLEAINDEEGKPLRRRKFGVELLGLTKGECKIIETLKDLKLSEKVI